MQMAKTTLKTLYQRRGNIALGLVLGSAGLLSYYVYAKRNHLPPTGTSVKMESTLVAPHDSSADHPATHTPGNLWNNP